MTEPEIIIGFIDKFKFLHPEKYTILNGHPKEGRIYRLMRFEDYYNIYIGAENTNNKLDGILLNDELSGTFNDSWEYNVIPLTKENYLDFPIVEEDLDLLLKWFETDHSDLKKLMGLPVKEIPVADDARVVPPEKY